MPRILPLPKQTVKAVKPDDTPSKDYYDWLTRAQDALQFGRVPILTVTTLPSATTLGAGAHATITDAATTTFNSIVSGTSTFTMPVFTDSAGNWRIG